MNIIDRYIGRALAANFAIALAGLLLVFSVMQLAQELGDAGTGAYDVREAFWFVLLTLPSEAYQLFPAAALLGAVIGLGALASHGEIVALAASGVSRLRLTGSVLLAAAVLAVVAFLLGEGIAGPLARQAHSRRSIALSGGLALGTANGLWARDGSRIVNVRTTLPDGTLRDLYVFDFDQRRLRTFTYAEGATWGEDGWTLHDLVEEQIVADGAVIRRAPIERLETRLGPRQLGVLFLPVENLSLLDLVRTADSLRERGEDARLYDYAFWRRAAMPLVAAVMLLSAIPLVLDVRPRLPLGQRVVVGALLGIGFQMLNDTFARFGLGYGIQPIVTALLPAALVLAFALWRSLWQEGVSA